jgi:hypothetical protein
MVSPPALPSAVVVAPSLPRVEPSLRTWAREIAAGETLDAVLAEAGLDAPLRAEVALALAAEFDLRRLRPGHALSVITTPEGSPRRVVLEVDDTSPVKPASKARSSPRSTRAAFRHASRSIWRRCWVAPWISGAT